MSDPITKPAEADEWHWMPRAAGHAYKRVVSELDAELGRDKAHRAGVIVGDIVNCGGSDIDDKEGLEVVLHAASIFGGRVVQVSDRVKVKRDGGRPDVTETRARAPLPPSVDPSQMARWLNRARRTGRGGVGEHGR